MLVLSRNGELAHGSPLRADTPEIWMDHSHKLEHVATGMMMHLA
jgi:FtsP/CotA-like multicopper oxidase with cupredoxin domain